MKKKNNIKNILLIGLPILILIIISIVIINILNKNNIDNKNNNLEKNKFKEEYEALNRTKDDNNKEYIEISISSDNIVKYSTETEIINIINNKGDAVVYFGYPECNYCRSSIEVLLNTAKDTKLDNIYYIDTKKIELSNDLISLLGEELTTDSKITNSLVVFITDGEIVSYNKDTLSSHKDQYQKLNDSQIAGLSEIYKYGINDVVASKEIKNS